MDVCNRIKTDYNSLTLSEQKIADIILSSFEKIQYLTLLDIARSSSTGQATVIRFCRKLGFDGFFDLKNKIVLKQKNQKKREFSLAKRSRKKINDSISKIKLRIDMEQVDCAIQCITKAQRVYIFGSGSLSYSALDMESYFSKYFCVAAITKDSHQKMYASLVTEQDLLIILATEDNASSVVIAGRSRAKTIIISNSGIPISFSTKELYLSWDCAEKDLLINKIVFIFITALFIDRLEDN